jgi:hypothetical protein
MPVKTAFSEHQPSTLLQEEINLWLLQYDPTNHADCRDDGRASVSVFWTSPVTSQELAFRSTDPYDAGHAEHGASSRQLYQNN